MTSTQPRALVISPRFFGYEDDIVQAFVEAGDESDFVDERPSNTSVARAAYRLSKSLARRAASRYFHLVLRRIRSRGHEVVLVVKGEVVPRWFLKELRDENPSAVFNYYTYDSLKNSPHGMHIIDLFERRFSFDFNDVCERGDFAYRPLFYAKELDGGKPLAERVYDLAFVGTLHSDRYRFVTELANEGGNHYIYFYVQARGYFAFRKYITGQFRDVPWSAVSFRKLPRAEVARIFGDSRAVLDMQRTGQSGLTMRTFEVIAAGAHLITVNETITRSELADLPGVHVIATDASGRPTEAASEVVAEVLKSDIADTHRDYDFTQHAVDGWPRDFIARVLDHRVVEDSHAKGEGVV